MKCTFLRTEIPLYSFCHFRALSIFISLLTFFPFVFSAVQPHHGKLLTGYTKVKSGTVLQQQTSERANNKRIRRRNQNVMYSYLYSFKWFFWSVLLINLGYTNLYSMEKHAFSAAMLPGAFVQNLHYTVSTVLCVCTFSCITYNLIRKIGIDTTNIQKQNKYIFGSKKKFNILV